MFRSTIRRKMVVGLTVGLVMLVTLALSGISGLRSYRDAVNDLDFSINQAPRQADISNAIAILFEPLLLNPADNRSGAEFQQREFRQRLSEARKRIQEFRIKLEKLPATPDNRSRRPVTDAILADIDRRFDLLEALQANLGNLKLREAAAHRMLYEVSRLETLTLQVPDVRAGLNETLTRSRSVYHSRFWLVCSTSSIAALLFLALVRYGYTGVFAPLRKLHQGAIRVAHGDFDYRLQMHTEDEMAELASAFNDMTQRFQEMMRDLDCQVRERSRQLLRSERLADLGLLSAGVAHEINNPLQAIMMASGSLQQRAPEFLANADEADVVVVEQYLGMILKESQRCKEITSRLLDFSRTQDTSRSRQDVSQIISEVISLVGHLGKYRDRNIEFHPAGPCHAEINGSEIKQVVLNLVSNALESMATGGTLRIDMEEQTDQLLLTFQDDGCGMTPEVLENIFEPFFTQRRNGRGTGLGMSISHRIISDHGGTIEVHSTGEGEGSTFLVRLPRRMKVLQHAA